MTSNATEGRQKSRRSGIYGDTPKPIVYARVVFILIASLLAAALVSVAQKGYDRNIYNRESRSKVLEAHREHLRVSPEMAFAVVSISVRAVDASEYSIRTVVTVTFLDATLTDSRLAPLGTESFDGLPRTNDAARQADGEVETLIVTDQGATSVSTKAGDFDRDASSASSTSTIPVSASPQYFPNDQYDLRARSWVRLPDGVSLVLKQTNKPARGVVAYTSFELGSGLSFWRARAGIPANSSVDARLQGVPSVELVRPTRFWVFVWAVCLVPTMFMTIYFLLTLAGYLRKETSHFELGIAILAILSMRQIFVPEGPLGITRLDHWLGLSLIICVTIAAAIALKTQKEESSSGELRGYGRPTR